MPKPDKAAEFKLEHYKYMLQQRQALNEHLHKYLALFQTLITAIAGGGVAIFIGWKELKIEAAVARVSVKGLLWLTIILTVFVIASILSTILAWYANRQEEIKLLHQEVSTDYGKPPNWKNFWRWHETYFIVFLLVVIVLIYRFTENQLLPLIK